MAGRGRGRGKPPVNIGGDQGFVKADILPPILQPPLNYPPLEYKPLPSNLNEFRYLVQLKKDFTDYMHDSPNNVLPVALEKDIERYSDRFEDLGSDKQGYETRYNWSRMPAELKPQIKKRKRDSKVKIPPKKKLKEIDINSKLQELEKKEIVQQSDAEEDEKDEEESEEKDVDENIEDQEEVDEEMDEGTDYVNNYFDNGENYEDDEENLDDGPIF